jgi:cellulose synthase/poly-beta-1,6-N-acetylglucosamine synthase-like glycosyltransferase
MTFDQLPRERRPRLRHCGHVRTRPREPLLAAHRERNGHPTDEAARSNIGRSRADKGRRAAVACLLVLFAAVITVAASTHLHSFLYLLYIGVSLVFGAIALTTLVWMLHAWRTPESLAEIRLREHRLAPTQSFSLIVPARHEQGVLESTLSRLIASDHPAFEVLVVVGSDDAPTRAVAERMAGRHPGLINVVVDAGWPKNKPRALNAALPYCSGTITGVFDAEDVVHPALLRRIDERFHETDADIVQAGVQLMNFRSSWLAVRNVLEYYFWFRSRLHLHARQRFIPLGGNTVFVRTELLRAVSGWDPDCLAEDCELGVRLSALGARTVVVYEPELATREECPPTLRAFTRQRTRWNQGYLQTLLKGCWRRLPLGQRALGVYILAMPYLLALAWLMFPVAIVTVIAVKAPVGITLVSFLPALPMLSMLAVEVAGLGDFCRAYGERPSLGDYARLIVGLPLYQAVLAFSAARAVAREARGIRGWEKTTHLGLHLSWRPRHAPLEADARTKPGSRQRLRCGGASRVPAQPVRLARAATSSREPRARSARRHLAGAIGTVDVHADGRRRGNGHGDRPLRVGGDRALRVRADRPGMGDEPLWRRVAGVPASGLASPSPPRTAPVPGGRLAENRYPALLARVRRAATSHPDLLLQLALIVGVGIVLGTNLLHWPDTQFDEGTYIGNAWAVQHGALAPYTYGYGHPPLAWLLIALWTWASGLAGHGSYSLETGRELMFVVDLVSCLLLYALARRLRMGRAFAAGAVLIFALSPVGVFYHRQVLLDNPAIAWTLAAFVLALTPRRRLWAFAGSGACFAASVLSKETTLVLLPALLVAAAQNRDRRTRRYCGTLFVSFFVLIALTYPVYAALKGELVPGRGHVSLIGETMVQLFTRKGTGSIFDPHSQTRAIVTAWLKLDPWLVGSALVLAPLALLRRSTQAVALAFLIQVAMILRPGYLPNMYVLGLLPFAALIIAGTAHAVWRSLWDRHPGRRRTAVAASALAISAVAAVAVFEVAPRWARIDRQAMKVGVDGPRHAAERWLLEHVSHDKRLIVTDDFWVYLVQHGFDHHAVRGGFYSRTVVSYWPLDYDPAVKRRFPHGWRDFAYVVSTEAMRDTRKQTPTAAEALDRSRVVVGFGRGVQRIEIRAITAGAHTPG